MESCVTVSPVREAFDRALTECGHAWWSRDLAEAMLGGTVPSGHMALPPEAVDLFKEEVSLVGSGAGGRIIRWMTGIRRSLSALAEFSVLTDTVFGCVDASFVSVYCNLTEQGVELDVLERCIESRRMSTARRIARADEEYVTMRARIIELEAEVEVARAAERKVGEIAIGAGERR